MAILDTKKEYFEDGELIDRVDIILDIQERLEMTDFPEIAEAILPLLMWAKDAEEFIQRDKDESHIFCPDTCEVHTLLKQLEIAINVLDNSI